MPERHFGEIEGVKEGAEFETREALNAAGVHRRLSLESPVARTRAQIP